jgi:minor extracellular serine protease Vpr
VFAINVHGRWSTAAASEFDIAVNSDKDPDVDFYVVGVDYGAVSTGSFDGRVASVIFDADGNMVNAWVAENPMNGSTILLPTLASDLGLKKDAKGAGKDGLEYAAASFSLVPEGLVDVTASALFDPHKPAVSSGQYFDLAPGATATLPLAVDRDRLKKAPSLGWLVVSVDDPNGAAQADEIPLGPLP